MMEQKNKKPENLEELKKERGKTCWTYLVAEEKMLISYSKRICKSGVNSNLNIRDINQG